MKKRIAAAVLGLVLLGGSGCHPWYLVKSQVNSEDWKERLPEITATRAGKAPRPLKLAILAPDECSTRSGAEASGEAVSTRLLLRNRCGVVMAELERAMVKRGWNVTSWKAVDQLVAAGHGSALQAAKALGANVMIELNSLEETTQNPLRDLNWHTEFHESDSTGVEGPVVAVPEARAQVLEAGLREAQIRSFPSRRVGASLNVTVVLVETGQAVWFYNWSHWQRLDEELSTTQLFHCNRRHLQICHAVKKRGTRSPHPGTRSGSEGGGVVGESHVSDSDAAYQQAAREAVEKMLQAFADWAG